MKYNTITSELFLEIENVKRFSSMIESYMRYAYYNSPGEEEMALLFIIANNDNLYACRNEIINLKERRIKLDTIREGCWCSSEKALLKLGFNLFNGYKGNYEKDEDCEYDVMNLFCSLDSRNLKVAQNAIKIRFC